MSAHNAAAELHDAPVTMLDPGNAGTITVTRSPCVCNLVSAGVETRTLALPTREGVIASMQFIADGGDITITVASAYNEAGSTTFVFANVGEFAVFQSFKTSVGVYFWRLISNSNIGNNALITQGAALTAQHATLTQAGTDSGDTAIQAIVSSGAGNAFGFVNAAEGEAVVACVLNAMVRLAEIEARLEAAGIVAAN